MSVFDALMARMSFLTQQTQVAADNIARMNIPGETAKVMDEANFKKQMQGKGGGRLPLAHTHGNHLSPTARAPGAYETRESKESPLTLTGNNIDYQHELQVANEASAQHLQATKAYGAFASMMRTIIGK